MREIDVRLITEQVRDLCIQANIDLGEDVLQAFDRAIEKEESPVAVDILKELKENARIAKEEKVPICQDTGFAVVFVELGQDVHLVGGAYQRLFTRVSAAGTERATSGSRSVIRSLGRIPATIRLP